ncbi:F0F1 ATP synthase subunit delta [Pararhizobium sp. IMCC21322]|uniref:F0F1 ATP synthase subunit delta n=1 Tax=Pararhizobium sp. IMCC21322 TaxID=3067903 RepID=UPI002742057D|nr:F0F1 ATP synthase subunit delta [Pararhizobium sp. IMCC21322]
MTETVSQENSGAQATIVSSGVATRYATALFELGLEEKSLKKIEADLSDFSKILADSDDLKRLVKSPVFSADEQLAALGQIFDKAGFSGSAANLIKIAAKNRRLFAVPGMISAFHAMAAIHRGEVTAYVVAAQKLDKTHLDDLKKALKKSLGKDVTLNVRVDPSILGGLTVKVGSKMIDTSLRTKLNSLKIALKEVG